MAPLCEVRVFSRRHRYAGTLDVLGLWRGAGALIDYKTGDPREVGANFQTAAYLVALTEMIKRGDLPTDVGFDEALHRYTLDGNHVPSVTQILKAAGVINFDHVPQPIILEALARGAAVHRAVHFYNEDDLDVDAFASEFPQYWPYVDAWITFRRESGFVLADSFEQLGAASHIKRYSIRLRKDGTYRVDPYIGANDFRDFLTLLQAQEIVARHRETLVAEVA